MHNLSKLLFLCCFLMITANASSQILWGIDINDFNTPTNWPFSEGLYTMSGSNEGNFDGILFIPSVGFVFYYEDAEIPELDKVYAYLKDKFGQEKMNKDLIPAAIRDRSSSVPLSEVIKDGKGYIFREWYPEGYKVRLFWNEYRFWVEVYKIKS